MGTQPIKMLIADRETLIARRIKEFLEANGVICELINSGKQVKQVLHTYLPDFVLIDLLLPECSATDLLHEIKTNPLLSNKNIKVIVTSGHNSAKNVKQVFKAGACDYLVKPFKVEDVLSRIVFHMQRRTPVATSNEGGLDVLQGSALYLHLMELILKEATAVCNPREKLFNLLQMLSLSMKAVRCSIIRTSMGTFTGTVIASSDDISVKKIKLDLTKYPEVIHTVNTLRTTAIENLEFNPELARLKKIVKSISFNSIIVTPIMVNGEIYGVVSARMDSKTKKFTDLQVRFCQLIAEVCSLIINSVEFFPYLEAEKSEADEAA